MTMIFMRISNIRLIMQYFIRRLFKMAKGLAKKGQRGYSNSMASNQEHQELQTLLDNVA
jgi:hypothetical protein